MDSVFVTELADKCTVSGVILSCFATGVAAVGLYFFNKQMMNRIQTNIHNDIEKLKSASSTWNYDQLNHIENVNRKVLELWSMGPSNDNVMQEKLDRCLARVEEIQKTINQNPDDDDSNFDEEVQKIRMLLDKNKIIRAKALIETAIRALSDTHENVAKELYDQWNAEYPDDPLS